MAWCAWLWVGHLLCCRRVSAGDQPTSVSLPVWRGHFLECSQSSAVVWSHGLKLADGAHLLKLLMNTFAMPASGWVKWARKSRQPVQRERQQLG